MQLKDKIRQILRKEYPGDKGWKAFIYWWLAANGYEYDARRSLVEFTDGWRDGGIDVIAWPIETQSRKEVLVVQTKYFRQPPTSKEIERFQEAVAALNGSLADFQTWLGSCRDELHRPYRNLRDERRRHRYIIIAPCRFDGAMTRWDSDNYALEQFLEKSFKIVISALLRCSSQHKKNEPAFYKSLESVKPAVRSATWHSRRKVRQCYHQYLSS